MAYDSHYRFVCPQCGSTDLLIKKQDLDEDGRFIGNPKVGCLKCECLIRVSDLVPQETSDGQILHMMKGGDEYSISET